MSQCQHSYEKGRTSHVTDIHKVSPIYIYSEALGSWEVKVHVKTNTVHSVCSWACARHTGRGTLAFRNLRTEDGSFVLAVSCGLGPWGILPLQEGWFWSLHVPSPRRCPAKQFWVLNWCCTLSRLSLPSCCLTGDRIFFFRNGTYQLSIQSACSWWSKMVRALASCFLFLYKSHLDCNLREWRKIPLLSQNVSKFNQFSCFSELCLLFRSTSSVPRSWLCARGVICNDFVPTSGFLVHLASASAEVCNRLDAKFLF